MLRLNAVIHFSFVLDKKSQSDFFQKRPWFINGNRFILRMPLSGLIKMEEES